LLGQVQSDNSQLHHKLKTEIERIKQTLVHEVFSFEDERHLERYIQYHQQAIIRLMDKLATSSSDHDSNQHGETGFQIIYTALEELLYFVERHFTKYFDQDAKAPVGYIELARKDARINIKKVHKMLAGKNADLRIVNLMLHVLKKIIDSVPDQGITYRKVMYGKEIQKELFRLLESQSIIQDIDEELRQVMYYLNYNSTKVLTYHAHYITALIDASETRSEKIEKLSFALKKINQAQVKPDIRYNQHGPSLRDQLSNYITEEIDYQEKLHQLSNNSHERPSDPFLQRFKLKFEASVAQLAYLLRILIETKFILNNNLSQLLHFIVKFVITKRAEAVSYGSLSSKFYSVESATKESVRSMLQAMIQHIDKN
jgi:hypothetical protein